MSRTAIAAFAFALAAAPAFAADFSVAKSACADAVSKEAGKTVDGAQTKLLSGRVGARTVVKVKVSYPDGSAATGECRFYRGEVESVELRD